VPDPHTVILVLNNADATLPFRLGENTAVILHPKSAATAATKPVGTGPFRWRTGTRAARSR
jgi:peptide/nickel transport system substrate-binding protein